MKTKTKSYMWLGSDGDASDIIESTYKLTTAEKKAIKNGNGTEFTTDAPEEVAKGAIKYDGGKSPVYRGALDYFPRALLAVAEISAFGASKYAFRGWLDVPDGYNRYSDALGRHICKAVIDGDYDPDSGLMHDAHIAWNAMARLELKLLEKERQVSSAS